MKKEEITKIFEQIRDCFEFHYRNAENLEDLEERILRNLNEIEEDLKETAN